VKRARFFPSHSELRILFLAALCAGLFRPLEAACPLKPLPPRREIVLDGMWQVAETTGGQRPLRFDRKAPVPGLCDMAEPPFAGVGFPSKKRKYFWYRTTFRLPGKLPPIALLRVGKAKYGIQVYLNGSKVGEGLSCFTAHNFSVRPFLRGEGRLNELVIRVGAFRDSVPANVPSGWDFEKYRYIPGIYDSVSLILAGKPFVENLQVAPKIEDKAVEVSLFLRTGRHAGQTAVELSVRDPKEGKVVSRAVLKLTSGAGGAARGRIVMPLAGCTLWTPENPYLYELVAKTRGDAVRVRFGMRSFKFDPKQGRALLNGKPYYLRGTNVCIFRFFEDDCRGDKPWRREWVTKLHLVFKSMHWNAIRYCIGFPPELWYEVADETGFLIQDEFPIWFLAQKNWPKGLGADSLVREYSAWMRERWNHPCVVIWDAQNESLSGGVTAQAIKRVRGLDRSERPWDNGWDPPAAPTDCIETHPYIFIRNWAGNPRLTLSVLERTGGKPRVRASQRGLPNPLLINEYGWLWLTREGEPTWLSRNIYRNLLGPNATPEQRRELYARYLAALTEFWRCHRECAGVLHFCGLTYSRPAKKPVPEGGATSDNFVDLDNLKLEPHFKRYVGDAFNPLGLMIDLFREKLPAGSVLKVRVFVINDTEETWSGPVRLSFERKGRTLCGSEKRVTVRPLGRVIETFTLNVPGRPGPVLLSAELTDAAGRVVRSFRKLILEEKDR